MESNFR